MTKTIIVAIGLGSAGALAAEHGLWPDGADTRRIAQWLAELLEVRKTLDVERGEREETRVGGLTEAEMRELGRYLEQPELREVVPGFEEAESRGWSALGFEVTETR